MTGADAVLTSRRGHVETWTLNRPDQRNPISDPDVVDALVANVDRVNADPQVRAVVLTGAGPAFSAGGNVKDMAARRPPFDGPPATLRERYRQGIQRIPRAMYGCDVPVVAAVNGPAIGAGCDLACMCDLRVASTDAVFAESFVRIGLIPGDGGAWLLQRLVGPARAAEMTLTGDPVDAATALEWGLVSRLVEPDALLPEAHALAERIAANPPQTVRLAKKLLREAAHQGLESVLELSAAYQAISQRTADHDEALTGLLEKRPTTYTGE
ncbi:MAG TPA: crotonase/enoyl-CoA hydratase family protein [Phycicoccus sp.]|nr:crotonase/enoyl-CoA hydratase family protein [Phycicoccus sp.]